jgi:CRISPR system Cascade subunit CasE
MYFSKLVLQPGAGARPGFWRAFQDEYKLHQALWDVFPPAPDAARDFIYRMESRQGRPCVYLVSRRKPTHDPENLWRIQTRPYEPQLREGQRLGFSLRANPVVTREGKRHDIVMDAKKALRQGGQPVPPLAELMQSAGQRWLQRRQENLGCKLESVLVDGYRIQEMFKASARREGGARPIRVATCDFQGVLCVTDPKALAKVLMEGVGKARAFGCGLLMVRPLVH